METSNNTNPEKLVLTDSEEFSQFINGYAVSWATNHFLTIMSAEQRIKFFTAIAQTYPEEWKEAIKHLAHPVGGCPDCTK